MQHFKVQHDKVGQKFYIALGEDKEALLAYTEVNDVMDLHHMFVPEEARGQGLAEQLALAAFEFARKNHMRIIPSCPYIRDTFLKEHPECMDLVTRDI
ncbi:MAG: N-acetyltransferase [Candidatus Aenigmarchaeota archaeon]|nr:N-acetyltransferase [Candidatus Aenigmarchaeota archaeon]